MSKKILFVGLLFCYISSVFAQGAKNIKINEVLTINKNSIQDEYGRRNAWIELANIAFSSYDVRGMYITTDKSVLNKDISVPERIRKMCQLPNDDCTKLSARRHVLFFLNSSPTDGAHHLSTKLDGTAPVWIALYDGNGVDLIDSVTVPILNANTSYARENDGRSKWVVKNTDAVTPSTQNYVAGTESKISQLKNNDPNGFGITVLAMGIVFSCLLLLYVAFTIMGYIMKRRKRKKEEWRKTKHSRKFHLKRKEDEISIEDVVSLNNEIISNVAEEEYLAVIAMALKEYEDNSHDSESGIITIKHSNVHWRNV